MEAEGASPAELELGARESRGVECTPELTAEISPAAVGGSCRGSLGRRGKKGLEAPPRAPLAMARAIGMLLGSAWDSRVDIRLEGGKAVVGLTL